MRIDLHCHTKKTKRGDGEGRNVTTNLFKQKVADADVRIVAITNHNHFDLSQYIELRNAVSGICQVWPGVEIDVKQEQGNRWHLVVVANPSNAEAFAKGVDKLFLGKCIETKTCTIQEIYEALNDCDTIYIAHFHKKPSISEEDREELLRVVGDVARVFNETSDHRALGVFANHGFNVLIGSDVKNWDDYEKSTFAELRLPVASFQQFCLLAKRDSTVVSTLLNNKKYNTLTASPHQTVKISLDIYEDINIIFGQKGTGKSEILQTLYNESKALGINGLIYKGVEKDEKFSDILDTKGVDRDILKVSASDCATEFTGIFDWAEKTPTLLGSYLSWCSTREHNANKSKMRITDSSDIVDSASSHSRVHQTNYKRIKQISDEINKIDTSLYLNQPEVERLTELLKKLLANSKREFLQRIIEEKAISLVNFSLKTIKSIADKKSSTVSKPASTGFREFALNRIGLKKRVNHIVMNLQCKEHNDMTYLGEIDGKGPVYINTKYRTLRDESRTGEFILGIRNLKDIVAKLYEIKNSSFKLDVANSVVDFIQRCQELKVNSLESFLGISKQIVLEDGTPYSPSSGEKSILMLQQILSTDADAYFLDEPELGMGNSYIDSSVRPILSDLAKKHKMVVVATHNANIAVRTLPYLSVLRTHKNGVYATYTGNPFDDRLVNIEDPSDVRSWTAESLHTLEGGKIAFYERKSIYETK